MPNKRRVILSFLLTIFVAYPTCGVQGGGEADIELVSYQFRTVNHPSQSSRAFDIGDTVEVDVFLTALNQTIDNVSATISSTDSCVNLTQTTSTYGSLVLGQNPDLPNRPFIFTIPPTCQEGDKNFTISLTGSGAFSKILTFSAAMKIMAWDASPYGIKMYRGFLTNVNTYVSPETAANRVINAYTDPNRDPNQEFALLLMGGVDDIVGSRGFSLELSDIRTNPDSDKVVDKIQWFTDFFRILHGDNDNQVVVQFNYVVLDEEGLPTMFLLAHSRGSGELRNLIQDFYDQYHNAQTLENDEGGPWIPDSVTRHAPADYVFNSADQGAAYRQSYNDWNYWMGHEMRDLFKEVLIDPLKMYYPSAIVSQYSDIHPPVPYPDPLPSRLYTRNASPIFSDTNLGETTSDHIYIPIGGTKYVPGGDPSDRTYGFTDNNIAWSQFIDRINQLHMEMKTHDEYPVIPWMGAPDGFLDRNTKSDYWFFDQMVGHVAKSGILKNLYFNPDIGGITGTINADNEYAAQVFATTFVNSPQKNLDDNIPYNTSTVTTGDFSTTEEDYLLHLQDIYSVNTIISPPGVGRVIVTPVGSGPDSNRYTGYSHVDLTAEAIDPRYRFDEWTVTGSYPVVQLSWGSSAENILMNETKNFTAHFSLIPVPPQITVQPLGQTVQVGQAVTLSVTATGSDPLSYQWLKDGVFIPGATSNPYVFNAGSAGAFAYSARVSNPAGYVTSDQVILRINPNLAAGKYALTVSASRGSVEKNPVQPVAGYNSGTPVTMTAMPNGGYEFSGWTGDVTGTANPQSVVMNSHKNITANFLPITGALRIITHPVSQTVTAGQSVTFSVEAIGTGTLQYQWKEIINGIENDLLWAQEDSLTVSTAGVSEMRSYRVTVSDSTGEVTSDPAMLRFNSVASVVPSRTSGVAPLSVFFDATGTTAQGISHPFLDLHYFWNFGDDPNDVWSTSGKKKNEATGAVAAHVFDPVFQAGETQQQFTVTMTVRNVSGDTVQEQVTITVQNPDSVFSGTNTICFSRTSSNDFTGCPTSALHVTTDTLSLSSYIANNKRILLRRGDSWNVPITTVFRIYNTQGPGLIGAYGSGNRPILNLAGNGFLFSDNDPAKDASDWRIMDLELAGSGIGTAFSAQATAKQILLYRVKVHDLNRGLNMSYSDIDYLNAHANVSYHGHTRHDQISIVDSEFNHFIGDSGSNIFYFGAERMVIMGTLLSDSQNIQHVLRTPHIGKGVISHNIMKDQSPGRHVLKLHAPDFSGTGSIGDGLYSEYIVISDNEFKGSDMDGAAWTVGIGPSDAHTDERVREVVIERNMFKSGQCSGPLLQCTQTALSIWAQSTTIRNNIFDTTGGWGHGGLAIAQRGIEPAPLDVAVLNNTFFSNDAASFRAISIGSTAQQISIFNNLASAARATNPELLETWAVNNTNNSHNGLTTTPGFVSSTPINSADFRLQSSSSAVDAGTSVAVFEDFNLIERSQENAFDLGAFEYSSTDQYTITANAGSNGSITPSGNIAVNDGSNRSFVIAPSSGYNIEDVLVDGVSEGAVSTYTFNNVTEDHTISATFAVNSVAPVITNQPVSRTITSGQAVTFTVVATGTAPLSYQWKLDGTAITGATSASYTINAVDILDEGDYTVIVSNAAGTVTSNAATLIVTPAAPLAPTNLGTSNVTADSITLSWSDASSNEDGFKVYRSVTNNSNYQLLITTAANGTSYTDSSLTVSTQYFYKVLAFNAGGNSNYSNEVNATTSASSSFTPVLNLMASTVTRMAPAAVHVHATDSTGITNWHRTKITWDFDATNVESDPTTTIDPRTGETVNLAKEQQGFNAAYVYQTAGTYTIRMTITLENGDTSFTETMVVINPDTRAIRYIDSVAGDDLNDGLSPATAWRTFDASLLTRLTVANGTRDNVTLLLKGGQVYPVTTSMSFSDRKNFTIGSYGSAEKAIIYWTGPAPSQTALSLSSTENSIIRDLIFRNSYLISDSTNGVTALSFGSTPGKNRTVWNCEFEGSLTGNAFHRDIAATSGNQGMFLLNILMGDSKAHHIITKADDIVIIGVTAGTSTTEHVMRNLIRNNRIATSWVNLDYKDRSNGKGTIRYQAVTWGTIFRSVLSRGVIEVGFDQFRAQHIILDGNDTSTGRVWGLQIDHNVSDVMLRNNVFKLNLNIPMIKMPAGCQTSGDYTLSNIDVVNNVFRYASGMNNAVAVSIVNTSGTDSAHSCTWSTQVSNLRVSNNLFVTDQTFASGNQVLMKLESSPGAVTEVSQNVYPNYCATFNCLAWGSTRMNLAAWSAVAVVTGEALETNAFDVSRDFLAPSYAPDPVLQSVTMNAGRMAPGVFDDYHGIARPFQSGSVWSAGAVFDSLVNQPTQHTITTSAGANGAISPSGTVNVFDATSQTFSITANSGYHIVDVLVDGVSVGAVSTYTFTNVTANHMISASFAIDIVVPAAPVITTQPISQTVIEGQSATFIVVATGTAPSYQWQKDGADISGATSAMYSIDSAVAFDAGSYTVVVSNLGGTATSSAAALSVTLLAPTSLATNNVTVNSIGLSWTDNSSNEDGFKIYRSVADNSNYQLLTTTAANGTSYIDSSLTGNTQYFYRVLAFNAGGSSSYSNEVNATTSVGAACSDGIDNDADGLVDWQYDLGCYGSNDTSEVAGTLEQKNGWTTFNKSVDTRIIYVSNSEGNNAWSGLCATVPTSGTCGPKATIAAGYALLRNGFPDWLLLKRGDTWTNENFGQWTKSGRSVTELIMINSYGDSLARPLVKSGTAAAFQTKYGPSESAELRYIAIVGIELWAHTYNGTTNGTTGVYWAMPGTDLLIEDSYIHGFNDNLLMQGLGNVARDGLYGFKLRRNVVTDSYSTGGDHTQGMFMTKFHDVLIEDNVFDHNGWREADPVAPATIFDRNLYLSKSNYNVTTRGNVIARSSSEGVQQRSGGMVEDNLFLQNSTGVLFGQFQSIWPTEAVSGTVRNNVVLDARDIDVNPRGFGIQLQQVDGVELYGNIIAHHRTGTSNIVGIDLSYNYWNVNIHNNIVYDWIRPSTLGGNALRFSGTPGGSIQVTDNDFQQPRGGILTNNGTGFTGFTFSNNKYFTASAATSWFTINNVAKSYAQWLTASGETGSSSTRVTYPDPDRTIETYMTAQGGTPTLVGFLDEAKTQSRFNWRSAYTAHTVNDYIRQGFGMIASTCGNGTVETGESCDDGTNNGQANSCNSLCSGPTTPSNQIPSITTQPSNQTVTAGQAASFTVVATGTPAPTYQWKKGGVDITGATNATYTISSTVALDAGSYTVVVSNIAGTVTSNAAILTVNTVPAITTQPTSQTVNVGQSASFIVVATGTAPLTYQWKKDGTNISGATSATYSISSAAATHAGSYTVVVSNVASNVTSSAAILTVNVAPTITTQPSNLTVNQGQAASFTVVASGTPTPTYQWKKDGVNISGATSATYSITSAAVTHVGSYTVVITNVAGTITSSGATLLVNVPPSITTHPSNLTVSTGGSASFSVVASGTAPLTYQWKVDGVNISGANSATYSITSARAIDAGDYTVVVTNMAGSVTSNFATLTINGPPNITTQPSNVTVTQGQSASFTVVATGTAPLTYQWKKGSTAITGATSATYTISSAATSDVGSYSVVVNNITNQPVTSTAATLTVNTVPAITTQPASQTVNVGQSASFTVVASGTAPLTYQWKKGSTAITGATSATYSIGAVAATDAGSYTVVVTNVAGSVTSSAATLTVNGPPVITTQPSNVTVTQGQQASFTVVASGTAPLSYQWKKEGNNITGATSATYTIISATTSDVGSYTVVVNNVTNQPVTSTAATLTVNVPPAITTNPSDVTVVTGAPASFSVVATGTAPLTYQWKKGSTAITGATSATYSIGATAATDAGSYTVVVTNVAGSLTSSAATLTVNGPPAITTQPSNVTVTQGQQASFTVVASGTAPLTYQWKKDGTNISGATSATYTISSTVVADAASYTVVVNNVTNQPVTSTAATLTVNVPPAITTNPSDVTVVTGVPASFSVVASGTAPLTYQWKKGTSSITGATSATYSIGAVAATDAGSYTVVVTNVAGSVTSSAATLTVNGPPTITTQPSNVIVIQGQSASFSVVATGTAPLTYQWKKGSTTITGATSATYTISSATTSDVGSYSVVVNNITNQTVTSALATLTVNVPPAITTDPSDVTVVRGSPASFSVVATGTAPLNYQWKKDGNNITGATSATYSISATAASDAGSYTVVVNNITNQPVTSAAATLTVNGPPAITTQPSNVTVTQGQQAIFTVVASGTAPLNYQWKKDGTNISGATSATYTNTSATTADVGSYTVVVNNITNQPVTSTSATLTVNVPPSITTQPSSLSVLQGQPASFSVVAAGTTPITYQWKKNNIDIAGATSATYVIASAVFADAADYTVVVSNVAGTLTSTAATLIVNAPPSITTQPSNQTANEAGSVTFTVVAAGTSPLSYQWQKSGVDITGATSASYTINPVVISDAASYRVVVTNPYGTLTSSAATLTVIELVRITTQPASDQVLVGEPASFSVAATGTSPLSYQWKKDGANITGATSASYTINSVVFADSGSYTVTVTNAANSVTSDPATLTVNAPPAITTQPTDQTANETGSATFTVVASGTSPLSYQWQKYGVDITGATSASYTINPVVISDAGSYSVVITNPYGTATSDDVELTVIELVRITSQPNDEEILVGESATFSVTATGTQPLIYQWKKDGTAISGATSASHTINSALLTDAGRYTVTVMNAANSVTSDPATLIVNAPPTITTQPVNTSVTEDRSTTLTVGAVGTAPMSYQWQKDNADIAGATSASYVIASAALSDAGSYKVIITNPFGIVTSQTVRLTVNQLPRITDQPESETIDEGDSVHFSVTVTGTAPFTYQWKKDGVAIVRATRSSYTINPARSTEEGAYTVVVTNVAGSVTSDTAILTVHSAPHITREPGNQSVMEGDPATFSVTVTGSAPLSYLWKKDGVDITGANSASYTISATSAGDEGNYSVVISNGYGTAISKEATLTLNVYRGRSGGGNQAPVVRAGLGQSLLLSGSATLSGTATDDGLPNPPAALTYIWSKVSGPGTVSFIDTDSLTTTVSFSKVGSYVLGLTANDGALSTTSEVMVMVRGSLYPVGAGGVATGVEARKYSVLPQEVSSEGLYTLTVANFSHGTVSKSPDKETYAAGELVTVIAIAQEGYIFGGWAGNDAENNSNPLIITMNSNKSLTPNFVEKIQTTYTLSLTANNGSISKSPDLGVYPEGMQVILTVMPDPGYEFNSWTGAGTSSTNPLVVTMDNDKTLEANFIPIATPPIVNEAVAKNSVEEDKTEVSGTVVESRSKASDTKDDEFETVVDEIEPSKLSIEPKESEEKSVKQVPIINVWAPTIVPFPPGTSQLISTVENSQSELKYIWCKTIGKGTVKFETPNAATTKVTFPNEGEFQLLLTVLDPETGLSSNKTMTIKVKSSEEKGGGFLKSLFN